VLRILLRYGARTDLTDGHGRTAMDVLDEMAPEDKTEDFDEILKACPIARFSWGIQNGSNDSEY
jgi:hypothetical protein